MSRRIKIAKGVSLNVSRSGVSTSAKVGKVTVNSRRGATVNVAKGVSYNVPLASGTAKGSSTSKAASAAVPTALPTGPKYTRRPFGISAGIYWALGVVVAILLGLIPAVGAVLLLAAVATLVVFWKKAPRQLVRTPNEPS